MAKPWLALLFPVLAHGALMPTNSLSPAKIIQIAVPVSGRAAVEVHRAGIPGLANFNAIVALPRSFDPRRSWPVLLVTAPSGSSAVQSLSGYTNTALAEGWVVTAVDGPKVRADQDNNVFAWAIISCLLDRLRQSWPGSKQWPFACAGFSGGAKRAAMTAAEMVRQRDLIVGVFMGGCNEDRASLGFQISRPGGAFLNVPMFLSNGTRDPIAGPAYGASVKESMQQTGFTKIRLETYDGQHRLDTNQLRLALEWFHPMSKRSVGTGRQ